MLPAELHRWLVSSMTINMRDAATSMDLPFFVDGIDETADINKSHAEFRFTGPFVTTNSPNHYHVRMIGNILLTSYMDLDAGAYTIMEWAGKFQRVMLASIPVYKYGNGGDLLGCLEAAGDRSNSVKIFHFGQISALERIRQSEVDALYRMDFTI